MTQLNNIMKKRVIEASPQKEALDQIINLQRVIIMKIIGDSNIREKFSQPQGEFSEHSINLMLKNKGELNLVQQTHKFIVSQIIYKSFFEFKFEFKDLEPYFFCFKKSEIDALNITEDIQILLNSLKNLDIPELLEMFHITSLNTEYSYHENKLSLIKSKVNLKDKGAVYTEISIAKEITTSTFANFIKNNFPITDLKILDFGCGTGRFYFQALDYLTTKLGISSREAIRNNLFAVDIDSIAIDILKIKALNHLDSILLEDIQIISQNIILANGLTENITEKFNSSFKESKFDIVLSNPPYFLLKINRRDKEDPFLKEHYTDIEKRLQSEIKFFRNSGLYPHSSEGMLNYYKLAIERILSLTNLDGEIGIICPSTLFSDLSSKGLRKHLLLENKIRAIRYFSESSKIFENIAQSTVICYISKGGKSDDISIKLDDHEFRVSLDLIQRSFNKNYEIPYIEEIGWRILEKLSKFDKLGNFNFLRNKRGELDLTIHKNYIVNNPTKWRLVRGKMISKGKIIDKNKEYVSENFLKTRSKDYLNLDLGKIRLICPQISNIDTKKRLNFVFAEPRDIIGNSCNYLSLIDDKYSLENLQEILNSYLLNWRFKITSGNNHISNYELDDLPLIEPSKDLLFRNSEIAKNIKICFAYGLSKDETEYILKDIFKEEDIRSYYEQSENLQS